MGGVSPLTATWRLSRGVADFSVGPGRHFYLLPGLVTSRERVISSSSLAEPGHLDLPLGLDPETRTYCTSTPVSKHHDSEDREGAIYLSRTVRSLLALCSATLLSAVTLGVSVPIASSASGPTGPVSPFQLRFVPVAFT